MRISYITDYNAHDVHNWSGLGFNIAQCLQHQENELDFIGNLTVKTNPAFLAKKVYGKLVGHDFHIEREPSVALQYARQIEARVKENTDVLFSPGTIPMSLFKSNKPKVFYTDATFAGILNFYDEFTNLSKETIKHGNYLEQAAIDSATLAIYSSEWAAQSAISIYKADPAKVKVVSFGANLPSGKMKDDIRSIIGNRLSSQSCNLLFLGVDWKRKGGDFAVKVVEEMNSRGIKTFLHVVGIKKVPVKRDFIISHGFISKKTKQGVDKLEALIALSHFLLLPTKADCTPVVYSEANSFGLPCISTNVGGIPTIIRDDINGKTFSLHETAQSYADYISSVFTDKNRYADLCRSSFNEFGTRLNWDVTGKSITKLLQEL